MASIYAADDPAAYELSMGRWSRRLAAPFIGFAGVGGAGRFLDVGCGTGSLSIALSEAAPAAAITGIDYSRTYADYARSRAASDGRLRFEQGEAAALPYGDGAFDAALSLLVLNFLPDPERAVREMARVMRSGGVVAATVWDFHGGLTFLRIFLDTAAPLDPGAAALRARQFSAPLAGPGEMAALWGAVGLHDVAPGELAIRMDFRSFADLWEPWCGGQGTVGAYVAGLDEKTRALVERHTRLAYLAGGADGPRSYTATAWVVRGTV